MAVPIFLRPVVVLAGGLGVFQSLAWICMTITGIMAHLCAMDINKTPTTMEDSQKVMFYLQYFQGDCNDGFSNRVSGVSRPDEIYIWMWVYLVFSFLWLISSASLLLKVTVDELKYANIFLYIWIFITIGTSFMDLALGIIFGLDYGKLASIPLKEDNSAAVTIGASVAAIMLSVALRGFVLWIINVACACYLFSCTLDIYRHNQKKIGEENAAFNAIDAYGFNTRDSTRQPPWHRYSPTRNEPKIVSNDFSYNHNNNSNSKNNEKSLPRLTVPQYENRDNRNISDPRSYTNPQSPLSPSPKPPIPVPPPVVYPKPYRNRTEPSYPTPDYSPPLPRPNLLQLRPAMKLQRDNSNRW